MIGDTRGKGPFANKQRQISGLGGHWAAPDISLTGSLLSAFLDFVRGRTDNAVADFFAVLAKLTPSGRLIRNLVELMRLMVRKDVTATLVDGLTDVEAVSIAKLEQVGIPLELLGVAHKLLNIRERDKFLETFSQPFTAAKRDHFGSIDG